MRFSDAQAQDLRNAGKEPYAYSFERTHMAAALHEQFASLENGCEAELEVCIGSSGALLPYFAHHGCLRPQTFLGSHWFYAVYWSLSLPGEQGPLTMPGLGRLKPVIALCLS